MCAYGSSPSPGTASIHFRKNYSLKSELCFTASQWQPWPGVSGWNPGPIQIKLNLATEHTDHRITGYSTEQTSSFKWGSSTLLSKSWLWSQTRKVFREPSEALCHILSEKRQKRLQDHRGMFCDTLQNHKFKSDENSSNSKWHNHFKRH